MLSRTIYVWALALPITLILFVFVLLSVLVDRSGKAVHAIGGLWSRVVLALAGVKVELAGVEKIPTDGPVIIVSNHQGAFDIPALQGHLPLQFRWVAKKSLFSIPVIGWSMKLAGYIGIDRDSAGKAYKSIRDAAERIKGGTSVLIFPEGTRSYTGKMNSFKRGAFVLAARSGVPVLPVTVRGSNEVMARGSLLIRPGVIRLTVGEPIPSEGRDESALRDLTKKAIEEILNQGAGALKAAE